MTSEPIRTQRMLTEAQVAQIGEAGLNHIERHGSIDPWIIDYQTGEKGIAA